MSAHREPSAADGIGFGLALAAAGVYFILVALEVLPSPDGSAGAPPAIVFAAGAAFVFAGLTCMVRARAGMTDTQDEVPEQAPLWTKVSYRVLAIAIAGSLAAIGTWIAIGSGPRVFNVTGPIGDMRTTGELVGRSLFALGAVIVWIYAIALTVSTVRRFLGRGPLETVVPAERRESRNP